MFKRILNISWRIAAVLAGLALIIFGIVIAAGYYDMKKGLRGSAYYCPEVADGVRMVEMNDYSTRLYRPLDNKYLTPRYAWICRNVAPGDSLTVYCPRNSELRGYLNARTGKVVIAPRFEKAWIFSEGLAFAVEDGCLVAIDPKGKAAFRMPGKFPKKGVIRLDLVFHNGNAAVPDSSGRYGIIDRDGNWLLTPAFTEIWPVHGEGWRVVRVGKRYGLLAPDLTLSIPLSYDYLGYAEDGKSLFGYQEGFCKQIAFDGTVLKHWVLEDTEPLYYPVFDMEKGETVNVRSDKLIAFRVGRFYGVFNLKNGSVVIPALYESVDLLTPDLIDAGIEYREHILFDARGHLIEKP